MGGSPPIGGSGPCSLTSLSFSETEATPAHGRVTIAQTGLDNLGADICAADCSIELWIRGDVAAQAPLSASAIMPAGVRELSSFTPWTGSNIVLDRSVLGAANPVYGIGFNRLSPAAINDAVVVFATRSGTLVGENGQDVRHVLRGEISVLDGSWHHVAVVRNAALQQNSIYVDGTLDVRSQDTPTGADLTLPAGGGLMTPFIVLAVEKHNFGNAHGFNGLIDELRLWNIALSDAQIAAQWQSGVVVSAPGLAAMYRFEEDGGTTLADDVGGAPATLEVGAMGDGTWSGQGAPIQCP